MVGVYCNEMSPINRSTFPGSVSRHCYSDRGNRAADHQEYARLAEAKAETVSKRIEPCMQIGSTLFEILAVRRQRLSTVKDDVAVGVLVRYVESGLLTEFGFAQRLLVFLFGIP
jgi:hypothetical protein